MRSALILVSVVALVALTVAISMPNTAQAAKETRVQICHATGVVSNGFGPEEGGNCVMPSGRSIPPGEECGIRITVNANALDGHMGHGDRIINPNRPDHTVCSLTGGQ